MTVTGDARAVIQTVREIYSGWMSLLLVRLRLPNGAEADRHVMLNKRAVSVLPYDSLRRTALLVSMPRAPVVYASAPEMLEAIGGALDEDDPIACARREAFEEAGVALGRLEHIGRIWMMPSNSTEQIDFYLAPYGEVDRCGEGGGLADELEDIRVHEMPLGELWRMFEDKQLYDAKLVLLLQTLHIRRPELFD